MEELKKIAADLEAEMVEANVEIVHLAGKRKKVN